jgi:hypothetical protein
MHNANANLKAIIEVRREHVEATGVFLGGPPRSGLVEQIDICFACADETGKETRHDPRCTNQVPL